MCLQDKEPKGIIPLENIQVRDVPDRNKPNCFELFSVNNEVIKACKTDSEGKVVEGTLLCSLMESLCVTDSELSLCKCATDYSLALVHSSLMRANVLQTLKLSQCK